MSGPEVLVPLTMFAGGFAMIFGIYYLKTRQNMAMIEKGMNPKEFADRPAPYKNLKWALLLVGAGIGLFLAYLLDNYVLYNVTRFTDSAGHYYNNDEKNVPIYFALIVYGGGGIMPDFFVPIDTATYPVGINRFFMISTFPMLWSQRHHRYLIPGNNHCFSI